MDKDQIEQRWDGTMGQTAISCTDRKLPGSLPELRLTDFVMTLLRRAQVRKENKHGGVQLWQSHCFQ
jgi:hypothetical protein